MSFDWRRSSVSASAYPSSARAKPASWGIGTNSPTPAASGLLIALTFAGYYALSGHFWSALLLAACLAAGFAALALIKAHREALADLAEARALQTLLAENAADLITRHDRDGRMTFASAAAKQVLGQSSARLVRRGFAAAMDAANDERCANAIAQCQDLGTPVSIEFEIALDGASRWIELGCKPLADGEGVVTIMRDVTTRRWHTIAMRQAREESESASRSKSAFIATISHELRTPLNAIIGFSEMLHRELAAQEGAARHADYSRIIRESGEHLMSLVRDLLDISKIEAGRLTICAEPFHAPDVIASSVEILRPAVAAKSITLDVSIQADLGEMNADRRALKQMLMNLLSNACKFTPMNGRISLDAAIEGQNAVIAVSDDGIGIAADHVARLGEPFYQVDSSHSRQLEGAGLGLAIVRGLAELHGGRLEIESTLGEGSCFRLVLPLDADMPVEEETTRDAVEAPAVEAATPQPIALVA